MSKRTTPHTIELSVPICVYAKRVLSHFYGEKLERESLRRDLLIAAGSLMNHSQRSEVFPANFPKNLPIDLIHISTKVPERVHHQLRIYDKEALRFTLGNYYNNRAKEIICNTIFLILSFKDIPTYQAVLQAFELYNIEPSELDVQSIYKYFLSQKR